MGKQIVLDYNKWRNVMDGTPIDDIVRAADELPDCSEINIKMSRRAFRVLVHHPDIAYAMRREYPAVSDRKQLLLDMIKLWTCADEVRIDPLCSGFVIEVTE